ncbi:MAG TPA: histidine phosphatase family protein [Planctomycetota bacterium]
MQDAALSGPDRADGEREAWCLAAGAPARRAACVAAFGAWRWSRVLAPTSGEARAWAGELAEASASPLELCAELARGGTGEPEAALAQRLLAVLSGALEGPPQRLLLVLEPGLPSLLAARALGMPLERAPLLAVDPGRAVLLRPGPRGFSLRRSNAARPLADGEEAP